MSDTQVPEDVASKAATAQPMSPGAMLRELRTAAGVDLAVLASMVKVMPQKLDALERDQYEELPDMTFARGLVASVCRVLEADPKPLLARMPARSDALHLTPQQAPDVAFRRPGDTPAPLFSSTISKVVLALIAILVAASAIVWFWPTMPAKLAGDELPGQMAGHAPQSHPDAEGEPSDPGADQAGGVEEGRGDGDGAATQSAAQDGSSAAASSQAPTQPGATTERVTPVATHGAATAAGAPTAAAGTAASSGSDAAQTTHGTAAPTAQVSEAVAASEAATASDGKLLTLKATGESWVGVRDATGKSLLNRTLKAGDTVDLDGQAPLSVVIGRKQAVDVLVRGQPFDDQSFNSATVARFQVK